MDMNEHNTDGRINGARLWASLMTLARIGGTEKGGVNRLALTELDKEGRHLFVQWAKDIGCTIRVDELGNIFARREGQDPQLPPVMTGSHIDTQPTGGKFDGNYGVLAGLEVLRTLNDLQIRTRAPLEVVVWTNEEGSRFVPVMMGSGVYVGAFSAQTALHSTDTKGISVAAALADIGYDGAVPCRATPVKSYFEAHIEQGPVLERRSHTIGVVTGALGQRWYDVVVQGVESHAGTTPMELRRDALLPAMRIMNEVNEIGRRYGEDGRGTVGWVDVYPNSRNVIPGRVRFSVDLRALTDDDLSAMSADFQRYCDAMADTYQVQIHAEEVVYFPPQAFAAAQVAAVEKNAARLGYGHSRLVSGAGHDAVYLARICPTAMIFIPCKDGISHNEIEDALPEHVEAGCNVLLYCMLDEAGVV
ncbi:hydantoinase/carbamoylase family amidase [Advenella kashmirensis WT001]|uniref:Hydantoinase/carbamoylase family amidase n=1 Tax=Advenella kashmirensis (strain DSM 17095 / LMG 22695 / WT001) TaxID=1036672 RepID=I3U941_ADVKW|nr:hydantoinase/carbamoylase family amidase [Advenella kashmirensis WT001]